MLTNSKHLYIIYIEENKGVQKKMPLTPKQMIALLEKNGFEKISQKGSHVKMRNEKTGKQTEVPFHCKDLPKGLEQAILKQAGLK